MVSKNNPLRDGRHLEKYFPYVDFFRLPLPTDIRHPKTGRIFSTPFFWRVKNKPDGMPPDTGTEGQLWYLESIIANVALWKLLIFTAPGFGIITVEGDTGGQVSGDIGGNIEFLGSVVDPATQPVFFRGDQGLFKQDLEIQVSQVLPPFPGDRLGVGLSSFNDTQFSKDNDSGMISLIGGSAGIQTLTGDAGGAVGPTGPGDVLIKGIITQTLDNGIAVFFQGTPGSNLMECKVQLAGLVGPAPPVDRLAVGLASFNMNDFTKDDPSGMISLVGGPPGFVWVEVAVDTALNVNTGYILNSAVTRTLTLPESASIGDRICFIQKGVGTIRVATNGGTPPPEQTIHTILGDTTTGVGGFCDTVDQWSSFCLICVTTNTDFALEQGSHGVLVLT